MGREGGGNQVGDHGQDVGETFGLAPQGVTPQWGCHGGSGKRKSGGKGGEEKL